MGLLGPSQKEIDAKVAEATASLLHQVIGALTDIGVDLKTPSVKAKNDVAQNATAAKELREGASATRLNADQAYQEAIRVATTEKNAKYATAQTKDAEAAAKQAAADKTAGALKLLGL